MIGLGASNWSLWMRRAALAVSEQGLVSGANFVLNIMLARWLSPEQYGAYALAFSLYVLLLGIHQNYFLEPMAVFGTSTYKDHQRKYYGALIWMQLAFSGVLIILVLIAAFVADRIWSGSSVGSTLVGMSITAPIVLIAALARATCYVRLEPAPATHAAAIYAVIVLSGCAIVNHLGYLSPLSVFLLMAFGAAISAIYLLPKVRPELSFQFVEGAIRDHWHFGRWGLASLPVYWAMENMAYLISGAFLGMREVGAARAIANTILPLGQMTSAIGRLMQPYVSSEFNERGTQGVARATRNFAVVLCCVCGLYIVTSTLFRHEIMRLLYGQKFSEYAYLLPLASTAVSIYVVYQAFSIGLRALHNPKPLLLAYIAAAVVSLLGGAIGVRIAGLWGIMIATGISNLTALVIIALSFQRTLRKHADVDEIYQCTRVSVIGGTTR
jgi:O-antigen/teichoic acid export membrane protein